MLSFENDYSEGAHEKILQRFMETNLEKVSGYGSDPYCESAKQKLLQYFYRYCLYSTHPRMWYCSGIRRLQPIS